MKEQNISSPPPEIQTMGEQELAEDEYIGPNGIIYTFPAEISREDHAYPSLSAIQDHERNKTPLSYQPDAYKEDVQYKLSPNYPGDRD